MTIFPKSLQSLGFELRHHPTTQTPYLLPPLRIISAGTFLMGSDPAMDEQTKPEECPQHTVWLPTYSIGTYPVTVAEYACAIQAQAPGVVRPKGMQLEKCWEEQLMHPNSPVYGLTWYDALGYARWLEEITGQTWRLPTEAEWEKAARGTDGRIYPWGNQWDANNANTQSDESQSEDRSITSIDTYPHAASPYGVIDMIGNVGEWTSTIYDEQFPYPYVATDGREDQEGNSDFRFRRLRGGCSLLGPSLARTAFRGFFHVDDRYDWLHGMRLVSSKMP